MSFFSNMLTMNRLIYLILIALLTVSCDHSPSGPDIVYCGYELSTEEYIQLREKTQLQESPYDADTQGHIKQRKGGLKEFAQTGTTYTSEIYRYQF